MTLCTRVGRKVLMTGASGLIGGLVIRHLSHKYDFTGLNRRSVNEIPNVQADVTDFEAIKHAFIGQDMVLHLAAYTADPFDWEGTLQVSVMGTVNVFHAAQEACIPKVVFMSSGSTMRGWEFDDALPYGKLARGEFDQVDTWEMLDYTSPTRPDSPYGIGKIFGEVCGRWFSDRYGMSVLCIRLGAALSKDQLRQIPHSPGYVSYADTVQIIEKCLDAPLSFKYEIFDALSENQCRWRDTSHAKKVLGWKPTGSSDILD